MKPMEPEISINGHSLTEGQAMTIRVAIQTFAINLQSDGLGNDEMAKNICASYLANIDQINRLMKARS